MCLTYQLNISYEGDKSNTVSCVCVYTYVCYMYIHVLYKYIYSSAFYYHCNNINMPFSKPFCNMRKLKLYILGTYQIIQRFILYSSIFFRNKTACIIFTVNWCNFSVFSVSTIIWKAQDPAFHFQHALLSW